MLKIPKRWRELPLDKRLLIPEQKFGIRKDEIERIRKISDKREKLIEAAKLEVSLFKELHTYLLVWIAGYGSDAEVRQVFGSTRKLRGLFFKSPENCWNIEFSLSDLKRNIKLPQKIDPKLAEETGIHLGDGNLSVYLDKNGYKSYCCSVTGDLRDERIYHKNFVSGLLNELYNITPKFLERTEKNSIETRYKSKAISEFKNKILGLPIGPKVNALIPKIIFDNNKLTKRCLVGIFDTDFHITSSLSMSGKLSSLRLTEQIHEVLVRNGIRHVYKKYPGYARFYIPQKESKIIAKGWGMHNPKHLSKFDVFDKFNVYIPFSSTQERLDLLNGKISLQAVKTLSNNRRISKD